MMCRVIVRLFLKPAQITHCPALAGIDAAVFEHERAHLLPVDRQRFNRCRSGVNEIAHRLVAVIGNSYRRQFTGP